MSKNMSSKIYSIIYLVAAFALSVKCGIFNPQSKSKAVHVNDHLRFPRQIHRYAVHPNDDHGEENFGGRPEKGQILHRPKSSEKNRNNIPSQNLQSMPEGAPMILNGRGKSVKYVPTSGMSGNTQGQGNSNNRPPQVYVISGGGDEEEDQGMMGSVQSYFRSMTGRIKAAMQGLIGGVTD